MTGLFVRELINAGWTVVSFAIVCAMVSYLWSRLEPGWYNDQANKGALAIAVYFSGTGGYRAMAAVLLYADRTNQPPIFSWAMSLLVVFAVVGGIGALCMIRIFSRPPGNWGTFATVISVAAVMSLVASYG